MSSYSQVVTMPRPAIRSNTRVSWMLSAIIPSVGAAIFAVSLAHVLFISGGMRTLFRDSDAGWHIRTGEAMLSSLSVPRADPFSFTVAGKEWFAWEWISDVLLGTAHRLAGPAGVALLAAFVIALTAWGASRFALALSGNLLFTAVAAAVLLGTTSIHWLARPHIFSWLIALVFLAIAERHRRSPSPNTWYSLPAISCLWANLHGSFLLGPGILFLYAAGEWMTALHENGGSHKWLRLVRWPSSATRFAVLGLASLAVTVVNPYGWKLHAHIASYLRDGYIMDHIAEFRSFSFHAPGAIFVELFLAIAVLGTVAMARQRAYGPALLGVVLLHFSLYSARYLPVAAVLLLPLSVAALTREADKLSAMRTFMRYFERVRKIDREIWGAVPVIIVLALTAGFVVSQARAGRVGFDPSKFPVQAAAYFEKRDINSRIYTHDQWGGYLIYRFGGRLKVFMDGRSDYYGREMLETHATINEVKPGWDGTLESFGIQFVLVPPDRPLASVLALKPEWNRVYADSTAAIFERVG
ncbi:MAG: hypothetical protein HYX72_02320 [Acidobacteria bacterium]|nr:hypothetical protein [Acidobacteriota bacterium]